MKESNTYPAHPPRPVPTEETAVFWENASAGRLVLKTCDSCGNIVAQMAPRCPTCLFGILSDTEFSGRARLKGRSTLHIPGYPGQKTPYTLVEAALVEESNCVLIALDPNGVTNNLAPNAPIRISYAKDPDNAVLATVQAEDSP